MGASDPEAFPQARLRLGRSRPYSLPIRRELIPIHIDAGAAIGFITNTCSIGRMKHIDLRESWVEQLRKKGVIKWIKVPGTANRADTFTKILQGAEFEKGTADLMVPLPTQGGMLE